MAGTSPPATRNSASRYSSPQADPRSRPIVRSLKSAISYPQSLPPSAFVSACVSCCAASSPSSTRTLSITSASLCKPANSPGCPSSFRSISRPNKFGCELRRCDSRTRLPNLAGELPVLAEIVDERRTNDLRLGNRLQLNDVNRLSVQMCCIAGHGKPAAPTPSNPTVICFRKPVRFLKP